MSVNQYSNMKGSTRKYVDRKYLLHSTKFIYIYIYIYIYIERERERESLNDRSNSLSKMKENKIFMMYFISANILV